MAEAPAEALSAKPIRGWSVSSEKHTANPTRAAKCVGPPFDDVLTALLYVFIKPSDGNAKLGGTLDQARDVDPDSVG